MSKLPAAGFAALVAATVGAFFVTQHLKVTTPLIAGFPAPSPAVINPYNKAKCAGVSHAQTNLSFYLLHRADDVNVLVVDQSGTIVRTIAAGHHMRRGVRVPDGIFTWDGRDDGGNVVRDGTYFFRISLIHQGRTVLLAGKPVTVKTQPPRPVVESVSPNLIPQDDVPVTIRYAGTEGLRGTIRIYRMDATGRGQLVRSSLTPWNGGRTGWYERIDNGERPPAGTYLVGLDVTDLACNTGRYPPAFPVPPGTTPHAGVTVRYLAVQPPLDPVAAGTRALVYVDSRRAPYRWSLWRQGVRKPLASGSSSRYDLTVPVPRRTAGLYMLLVRTFAHGTAVPLVAQSSRSARILVVLPTLTWQGLNPLDDDGDGLPNTLDAGGPVDLVRPLVTGLPVGFDEQAAFLAYLDKAHLGYDLTTDLGLIHGVGPGLAGHRAVVLAGSERWVSASLAAALRSYVAGGGHVLSLGIDSLRRRVTIRGARALDPTQAAATDVLGARPGVLVSHSTELVAVIRDQLSIFSGTSGVFPGFSSYQPFVGAAGPQVLAEAGATPSAPSIVAYQLGRGLVVDVGLVGFEASLARNVDAQELLGRLWTVLGR